MLGGKGGRILPLIRVELESFPNESGTNCAALDNREQFNSGFRLACLQPRPCAICRSLREEGGVARVSLDSAILWVCPCRHGLARLGSAGLGWVQPRDAQKRRQDRSLMPYNAKAAGEASPACSPSGAQRPARGAQLPASSGHGRLGFGASSTAAAVWQGWGSPTGFVNIAVLLGGHEMALTRMAGQTDV